MVTMQVQDRADYQQFRASTAWGDAVIEARGLIVAGVRPPVPDAGAAVRRLPVAGEGPVQVRDLAAALDAYLDGEPVELATPQLLEQWLDAAGVTGFARAMSMTLFGVPRGVTVSYGELAALAGRPGAARAVGTACARTPLPIIVPCHRVVRASARRGDVGPYGDGSGGVAAKLRLLQLEDAALVRAR